MAQMEEPQMTQMTRMRDGGGVPFPETIYVICVIRGFDLRGIRGLWRHLSCGDA